MHKQMLFFRRLLVVALLFCILPHAQAASLDEQPLPQYRALLVVCDAFVSAQDMTPAGQSNISMMEMLLERDVRGFEISRNYNTITSRAALESAIQAAFLGAGPEDVSLLYFSTHGLFEHEFNNPEGQLLLSNGITEETVSAQQLNAMLDKVPGTKVLLVDACNSGALIGKGVSPSVGSARVNRAFQTDDYHVFTSSGASEPSWFWTSTTRTAPPGSSYFTTALAMGAGWLGIYPADANRDGVITLAEMYNYLWLNQASSVVQIMPQEDSFPLVIYNSPQNTNSEYGVLTGFVFQNTRLNTMHPVLTFTYTITRATRVVYRLTPWLDGEWAWDMGISLAHEDLFPDETDDQGTISPSRKRVELDLTDYLPEDWSYAMLHIMTATNDVSESLPLIYASRVLSARPSGGDPSLSLRVSQNWTRSFRRELEVFVGHSLPCSLTISIENETGQMVKRLAASHKTRPQALTPNGSLFYWNGYDESGQPVPPGKYLIETTARVGEETYTEKTWITVH